VQDPRAWTRYAEAPFRERHVWSGDLYLSFDAWSSLRQTTAFLPDDGPAAVADLRVSKQDGPGHDGGFADELDPRANSRQFDDAAA
jgi:hypothetical protein